jgi:tRNA1(Val) A37 N6-methylase TrmN6
MVLAPGPGETLSRLSGEWWVFQLERGHRYATDDVLTAWTGVRARPDADRLLDLGAGVGSVGLMALNLLPAHCTLVAVEVLELSADLTRRTIAYNRIGHRAQVRCGDLREAGLLADCEPFDLITANPPYLPAGAGCEPGHPQRRSARFEVHGDVFDYCATAARHLATNGRFCFCHAAADPRPQAAVAAAGLQLLERREVVFRRGRPPHLALHVCGREGDRRDADPLCIREADGQRSHTYVEVLREMEIVA